MAATLENLFSEKRAQTHAFLGSTYDTEEEKNREITNDVKNKEMVRNQKRSDPRVRPLGRCLRRCVRANRTPPETLLQREPPETHLAHHIPGANLRFIIVRGVDATETFVGFRHLSGLLRELGGV
jgi:hypothetical protein